MLTVIKSYSLSGIYGNPVDVEIDIQPGIPCFDIVGLAGSGIKEARNRIRSAIKNSGFDFVPKRITVNLAPADTRKDGSFFDLPIAIGFLISTEQLPGDASGKYMIAGELSLDGTIRGIRGMTAMLISAYQDGYRNFIIPADNEKEASFIEGISAYAVGNLTQACAFLGGILDLAPVKHTPFSEIRKDARYDTDMSDVKGQAAAKRALEIAVAGGHNLLMCGSPGVGKTMLAKCIPSIMPDMTFEEAIETTKIHSISGLLDKETGIVSVRPFRKPHHTASYYSLTGGGNNSLPGEVSLAHNGVLFLDELPEYPKKTLESLRQPVEDRVITVSRVMRTVEYPANFMFVASMNPCPCGYENSKQKQCTCTTLEKHLYRNRLSGPLLDRIDIYVDVDDVSYDDLRQASAAETSAAVKKRIEAARLIQQKRYKDDKIYSNAQMQSAHIRKYCRLDGNSEKMLANAAKLYSLSARGVNRVTKLARTIADLRGAENIEMNDMAEATQFRVRKIAE